MSSRESILAAIKSNKPAAVELPAIDFVTEETDVVEKFITTLSGIGGKCIRVNNLAAIDEKVAEQKAAGQFFIQGIAEVDYYNASEFIHATATEVESVDTVYIKGTVAVAENGSIWIPETNMVNRLLPFICQHLVILVDKKDMVSNMHQAYDNIKVDTDGYGAFIAGPSKTADIEQSLVIGAHGPLSLTVFIID